MMDQVVIGCQKLTSFLYHDILLLDIILIEWVILYTKYIDR